MTLLRNHTISFSYIFCSTMKRDTLGNQRSMRRYLKVMEFVWMQAVRQGSIERSLSFPFLPLNTQPLPIFTALLLATECFVSCLSSHFPAELPSLRFSVLAAHWNPPLPPCTGYLEKFLNLHFTARVFTQIFWALVLGLVLLKQPR